MSLGQSQMYGGDTSEQVIIRNLRNDVIRLRKAIEDAPCTCINAQIGRPCTDEFPEYQHLAFPPDCWKREALQEPSDPSRLPL